MVRINMRECIHNYHILYMLYSYIYEIKLQGLCIFIYLIIICLSIE